jgi:hypothetical protein
MRRRVISSSRALLLPTKVTIDWDSQADGIAVTWSCVLDSGLCVGLFRVSGVVFSVCICVLRFGDCHLAFCNESLSVQF